MRNIDKYYKQMSDSTKVISTMNSLDQAYKDAMFYYKKLKEQYINQLYSQARIKDTELQIKTQEQIEREIALKALNRQQSFEHTQGVFKELEQEIASFLGDRRRTNAFTKKMQQHYATVKNLEQVDRQQLRAQALSALPQKGATMQRLKNILATSGIGGVTSSDLTTRFTNYFTEGILEGVGLIQTKTQYSIDKVAGYTHELAALQGLSNAYNSVIHAGAKNVSADVFMTTKSNGNIKDAITQLQTIEQKISEFNGAQGRGEAQIEEFMSTNTIEYFGSQVKLYSVSLQGLSRAQGYGVGHRQNLLNTLIAEHKGNHHLTLMQNIGFFNQWQRIVQAMGVANIVWSTGYAQYWMDEFIQSMRNNYYTLQFNQNSENELTSYVKWGQFLTKQLHKQKAAALKKK